MNWDQSGMFAAKATWARFSDLEAACEMKGKMQGVNWSARHGDAQRPDR